MHGSIIEVKDLTFYYPHAVKAALNNITFSIKEGEFVGITGPTGAGKSTLSLCLNGVIPHYQQGSMGGQVLLQGKPIKDIGSSELARTVGSVFEDPEGQIVSLTVEEEIAFGLGNLGVPRHEMVARIDETLDMVGIHGLKHRNTDALSGGQKQRVAIAAVLAMLPKIIVLDEPTSELDPLGTEEIFRTLAKLNKKYNITVVLIEQKMDQLARYLDRLIVVNEGSIVADSHPRDVFAKDKLLTEIGVQIPQIFEFALTYLEGNSQKPQDIPLSVEEGYNFVEKILKTGR